MIDQFFLDLPLLGLLTKFMIASTCLLSSVWALEKIGIINTPDIAELAWKLAIAASFIAILPISLTSHNITIPVQGMGFTVSSAGPQITPAITNDITTPNMVSEQVVRPPLPPVKGTPYPRTGTSGNHNNESDSEGLTATDGLGYSPSTGGTFNIDTTGKLPIQQVGIKADMLILTWAVLAFFALLALTVSYRRAVASLGNRERVSAEHKANQALRTICENADIRHVPYLSRSNNIDSPVCLPRREICLPTWAFDDMDDKALHSLIAHELAHMLRRDPAQIIFLQTLCRVCFFQPLFALARRRLEDCAELAADEWAAKQLSSANAVAEALYTCAKKITQKRQIQWGLAMAGDKSILRHRVERLVKAQTQAFDAASTVKRSLVSLALACIIFAIPNVDFATALSIENSSIDQSDQRKRAKADRARDRTMRKLEEAMAKREATITSAQRKVDIAERALEESLERLDANQNHATTQKNTSKLGRAYIKASKGLEKATEQLEQAEIALALELEKIHATGGIIGDIDMFQSEDCCHTTSNFNINSDDDGTESGSIHWSNGKRSIKASWDGRFTLSGDERSITALGEGGDLQIRTDNERGQKHRIRLENNGGVLETTYWLNADKRAFDEAGEAWLAETLQQLLQYTAIDMENRIARYLKDGGTEGALKRLGDIQSDYVKRMFIMHLTRQAAFSEGQIAELLRNIRSFESDYEIRLTLLEMLNVGLITPTNLQSTLKALEKMESDYEIRLTLASFIDRFTMDDQSMKQLLELAQAMESDYELRLLLSSAMEHNKLSDANKLALINVAESITSDYELRLFIGQFVEIDELNEMQAEKLARAARAIEGDYEKRLALSAIIDKGTFKENAWLSIIQEAQSIEGDYEKRLLLEEIKGEMPESEKLQQAWIKAAQSISGKHERRLLLGDED